MGSNRKLWSVVATVALSVVVVWFSTSWGQGRGTYQTETRVYTTPEYQTDTTRAINAYEKVMQRYMDMTERNFGSISTDMKAVATKLDAIDAKLAAFDARLARIEKHLGMTASAPPVHDANAPTVLRPTPQPQGIPAVPAPIH
jgi:hypothetical protein